MKKNISINIDNDGKIKKNLNLWVDEYPYNEYIQYDEKTNNFEVSQNAIILREQKICIEYSLPKHISNYALLGVRYVSHNENHLEIIVKKPRIKEKFNTEIECLDEDDKYKGLLKEYEEEIIKEVANVLNSKIKGKIIFEISAYCETGSSKKSFKVAVNILLNLLYLSNYTDEKIIEIFNEFT